MLCPKRVLALAGCALFAATCTQDTTTAPAVAADVGIAALPTDYWSEGGTITFVKERGMPTHCEVKLALNNLYAAGDADYYLLYVGETDPPYGSDWSVSIVDAAISSRGTYRATASSVVPIADLQDPQHYLFFGWYIGTASMDLIGIGHFYADATGDWLFDYHIQPSSFKIVNRCF